MTLRVTAIAEPSPPDKIDSAIAVTTGAMLSDFSLDLVIFRCN